MVPIPGQTDRQTDRQTDSNGGRQTDGQTDSNGGRVKERPVSCAHDAAEGGRVGDYLSDKGEAFGVPELKRTVLVLDDNVIPTERYGNHGEGNHGEGNHGELEGPRSTNWCGEILTASIRV